MDPHFTRRVGHRARVRSPLPDNRTAMGTQSNRNYFHWLGHIRDACGYPSFDRDRAPFNTSHAVPIPDTEVSHNRQRLLCRSGRIGIQRVGDCLIRMRPFAWLLFVRRPALRYSGDSLYPPQNEHHYQLLNSVVKAQ